MANVDNLAWGALTRHRDAVLNRHLRDCFSENPQRFSRLSFQLDGLLVDFSKQRVDLETLDLLLALARDSGLDAWRDRFFSGEKINFSEDRAVLHPALRHLTLEPFPNAEMDVMPEVRAVRAHMRQFSERVRAGLWRGFSRGPLDSGLLAL